MLECPICMNEFPQMRTLTCCGHSMCTNCTLNAVVTRGVTCALCRQIVCGVDNVRDDIVLSLTHGRHAGITLRNHSRGVVVSKVTPNDEARKHLRVGDVITRVHGLPAVHHKDVILQINEATRKCIPLHISCDKTHQVLNLKDVRKSAISFHALRHEWNNGHTPF